MLNTSFAAALAVSTLNSATHARLLNATTAEAYYEWAGPTSETS